MPDDPLEGLKRANPDINPSLLEKAVQEMLSNKQHVLQISESRKRSSDTLAIASPNPFRALGFQSDAAEASTSTNMAVSPEIPTKVPNHHPSPAKGSPAELAFLNSKKAD